MNAIHDMNFDLEKNIKTTLSVLSNKHYLSHLAITKKSYNSKH